MRYVFILSFILMFCVFSVSPTYAQALPGGRTADANDDGVVNGVDYVVWFNNYGNVTSSGAQFGDFNSDTKVDGLDYVLWLNNYNTFIRH